MRIKILYFLCTFAFGSAFAQYSIDLSKVSPPAIRYLRMGNAGPAGEEIRVNNLYMEKGGIPVLPVMGEMHYNRTDSRYWRDVLLKMRASGVDIVSTYCLWSLHEEFEGTLSWEDRLNLRRFLLLCKELDMKVHLRIGPYCNAEIRNGGLPDWIVKNKSLKIRSNDPLYLEYVRRWYGAVYGQVKGLLYKDRGPVIAIQLENEYVKKDMIISHLLHLKKMAVDIGFDVPVYSMTHWMATEYPKGEIVPYAGFYIEAPWTASKTNELPVSDFEFFTYQRIADNIGTDIIKMEGKVESLGGKENDSPFFTCEVGVGTATFYRRRAIVPQEMAGENINLRLGCGANMMGYYMYAGGTNPVGEVQTFQSSGPQVSYDYQAPIREFGTLGDVMPEVKKYNYFMNDFGAMLAPAVAYLPVDNQNRENLQWAVRLNGNAGYLFCSNYLYRHDRKDYDDVRFNVKLDGETVSIPRKGVKVCNGAYFLWPFNQYMADICLKYSTTQPVCFLQEGDDYSFFFFEDDDIPGEYLISDFGIKHIEVQNGILKKEKNGYFVNRLAAGKECVIKIIRENGSTVRFFTLTEEDSDYLWKGKVQGKEFKDSLSAEYEQKPVINDDMPEPSTCIIKHHILIVDDNVDMAKYLQDYYGQTNVVSVAYNASQAIELLSEHVFDIVISDVMMPDINGFTLCKRIKHNPETSNIVCILLTALCDAEFIVKGIHSGADDYITKPFSLEVLDAKLSNIIALKRRRANPEVLTNTPNTPIYTSLEEEFVLKVTQIINAHLEDAEYRITDLAEELCMSPSKLNRKFMDIVGKPPIEFIKKIRLQQAKTLLDSQRYSISEICYMVGFSTPTYFSICFKKEFGYSPSSYLSKKTES